MKVLVDTSVWSLSLRRRTAKPAREALVLEQLIHEGRVTLIGAIRQELLSGIQDEKQFAALADHLAAFPDIALTEKAYVQAAAFYNQCRSKGIQGSNTDFLICSVSVCHEMLIYTTDKDFQRYSNHLPIRLFQP